MQRFISKWRHDCIISYTATFLQYFKCIILSSTFAIPSSISLIFLKSTQFAPSQLFLLNILFWISLSGLFFQISRKFLFADQKLSTFSPISLILATSSGSSDRWLRDGGGWCHAELERCRSGRALARLKKFFVSFGRGLFGIFWQNNHRFRADWSGSIYFATIYHNSETFCPEPVDCGEFIIERFRDLRDKIWYYKTRILWIRHNCNYSPFLRFHITE